MTSPSDPQQSGASEPAGDSGLADGEGAGKGIQITIGALVVAALLGWYGYTNLESGSSFQYFQTLDEFLAQPPPADVALRVHGYVASESIERDLEGKQVHFRVQNDPPHAGGAVGETLPVVYASLETPDLFKDGAEVVIEGHMQPRGGDHVFVAENVMAKCPSKFEAEMAAGGQPPEAGASL